MARNYLSGRVSRASFGIPGYSTSGDLSVDVSGAIGVETSEPRSWIDTPEISIRGDIIDADEFGGGLGYFLSKDTVGVKWVAASPLDLTFVRVFDNGVQVGPSSFSGLNFSAGTDETFVTIIPNVDDPSIADISYDVRWIKFGYGPNFGIATGFGPDGTYASLPGYGTSEASGITSVGVGTIQPQDDFQVGIGSTGVTINGALGLVDAERIKAKSIEVEGNLEVESLVVRPGFATLTDLDVLNEAFIPREYVGFSSIVEAQIDILRADQILAGVATFGFPTGDVFILNDLYVEGGLGTFSGDVYVGGDLTVAGDTFFKQLNAENIVVTGIATINQAEIAGLAVTNLAASGFSTLTFYSFDTGFGTSLFVQSEVVSVSTITKANVGDIVVGNGTATDFDITGVGSVGFLTATNSFIGTATVGVLTVLGDSTVSGVSTFVGLTTFQDDVFVGGNLDVKGDLIFEDLFGENLVISGVGTIVQLESNIGIITALFNQNAQITGVATIRRIEAQFMDILDISSRNIENSGFVTSFALDVEQGFIGIVTGNDLSYDIGTFNSIDAGVGTVTQLFGSNLRYNGLSEIDGTVFSNRDVEITRNLEVLGLTTFRGVGTFGTDLYVDNDLFVGGKLFFEQIEGDNLLITGVATVSELQFNVGIGTSARIENLDVTGIATVQNTDGIAGTFTRLSVEQLVVEPLGRGSPFPGFADIDQQVSRLLSVTQSLTAENVSVGAGTVRDKFQVQGETILNTADIGIGTIGIATITAANIAVSTVGFQTTKTSFTGLGTFTFLTVETTGTYEQDLIVEGTAFINDGIVIGVSTIQDLEFNSGVGTNLVLSTSTTGIATIGLASVTRLEATSIDAYETNVAISTVGFAEVGTALGESALLVTGISSFVGFVTVTGEIYLDGDLTVTGVTSFAQLDSAQSQIGILTVGQALDASDAISSFKSLQVLESTELLGVATIGLSTFQNGDLNVNRNLTIGGITTFQGVVNIEETSFVNAEVTGVASITKLFVNAGIATNFAVDQLTVNVGVVTDLTVTGFSTFVGFSTFEGSVAISDDLAISRDVLVGASVTVGNQVNTQDLAVTGVATIQESVIGISTIAYADITDAEVGVATIGVADIGNLLIENLFVSGLSTFIGLSTFSDIEFENSEATGVSTFNDLNAQTVQIGFATVGFATIRDQYTSGVSTSEYVEIGVTTEARALYVSGVSTFVGFTTFTGDVFVDGNLDVTGIVSFIQLDAQQSQIGILTVSEYLQVGDIIQEPAGFSTFNRFTAQAGVITSVTSEETQTGILTVAGKTEIGGSLDVAGITSLGNADPVLGFTTVRGDLYIGGDLFVADDIKYDEITGRNLSISGVATIANLNVPNGPDSGIGTIWNLQGDQLDYRYARFDEVKITELEVSGVIGTSISIEVLDVSGLATFRNRVVFEDEVTFEKDVSLLQNLQVADTITTNNLNVIDLTATNRLRAVSGIITGLTSEDILSERINITDTATVSFLSNAEAEIGIATITTLDSTTINNSGLITSTDVNVSGVTSTFDLFVTNTATFIGEVRFDGDVTVREDLSVVGFTSIVDFSARNGSVGVVTALRLETGQFLIDSAPGNSFEVDSDAVFKSGLDIEGVLEIIGPGNTGTLVAGIATITTLVGDIISYDDADFQTLQVDSLEVINLPTDPVDIQFDLSVGRDLDVLRDVTIGQNLQVAGIITAPQGSFAQVNASVSVNAPAMNFDRAQGQDLRILGVATVAYAEIDDLVVGVATVGFATVTDFAVGVVTAYERYDLSDTTTFMSFKAETNTVAPTVIYSLNPTEYGSFEISIDAREAGNVHSTKIHGVLDNNAVPNAFTNEYSTVFNAVEVAQYDFVTNSATAIDLEVTPANANTTEYVINITAIRRYT